MYALQQNTCPVTSPLLFILLRIYTKQLLPSSDSNIIIKCINLIDVVNLSAVHTRKNRPRGPEVLWSINDSEFVIMNEMCFGESKSLPSLYSP